MHGQRPRGFALPATVLFGALLWGALETLALLRARLRAMLRADC